MRARMLRERLERLLMETLHLRASMLGILAATVGTGVATNVALHRSGIASLPLRFGIASVASYVVFLVLVRAWLAYVTSRIESSMEPGPARRARRRGELPDLADVADLAGEMAGSFADGASHAVGCGPSSPPSGGIDLVPDLDEGAVIVVIAALVAVVVAGGGIYLLWFAPAILAEAAGSVLVASMLARTARVGAAVDAPAWLPGVVRSTVVPFALTALVLVAGGLTLESAAPGATTVAAAVASLGR